MLHQNDLISSLQLFEKSSLIIPNEEIEFRETKYPKSHTEGLDLSLFNSGDSLSHSHVLKTGQQAPNVVTYAELHITKLRLNYSFDSPGKGILNHLIKTT